MQGTISPSPLLADKDCIFFTKLPISLHIYFNHKLCMRTVVVTNNICKFSERFRIQPCSNIGQQKHTQFCKLPNKDCVVSLTSLSLCEKEKYIAHVCDIDDLNCDRVNSIKM